MIWLALIGLALVVGAVLLRPLWRTRRPVAADAPELAFYRDQLAEIERDAQLGVLSAEQAGSARIEVQRRLLAVASPHPARPPASRAGINLGWGPRLTFALPLLAILTAGSLALYLEIGSPDATRQVAVSHTETADAQEFARLVDQLRAKLKDNPRDVDGWLLLARSLRTLERLLESAEAYMRALALSGGRPDIASTYGETLIELAQGTVTPEALDLFRQALARDPKEPRARFYTALAKSQAGDVKGAIEDWTAMLRDAPPDAPYVTAVREQIAEAAQAAGAPMPALPPIASAPASAAPPIAAGPRAAGAGAAPRGPSQADMAAAATMSPEDRQQMIRGMVDGLAARLKDQPDDIDGWLRLGRAYSVLGEPDNARNALRAAAEHAPQRADVLVAYAQALYTPERAADKPPAEFIAVMRRVLALDPGNAKALWFVGNDLAATGDKKQAAELFKRLLDRLPPNAPLRPQVQRQLQAVQGG